MLSLQQKLLAALDGVLIAHHGALIEREACAALVSNRCAPAVTARWC
jgi:hypothetical protein